MLFISHHDLGATMPASGDLQSFGMEFILTFFLMFVILGVATGHKERGVMAGVAIGGIVALGALIGGPVSGASMNPARSLGPALVSGEFSSLWIYFVAPVAGALLAVLVCRLVMGCHSGEEHTTK
jgi:aquaporin Z